MRILSSSAIVALLLALLPAPALAAGSASQSRLGRGFGSRGGYGRSYRPYRPVNRYNRYRSPRGSLGRGLVRGVLQALGIAYLFHMLFGLGAGGGSPLGLLIVGGLVLWLVLRTRARSPRARWSA